MAISIKTTPNDVGLRDLKTENEQPASARETNPVPAYPRTHARRSGDEMLGRELPERRERVDKPESGDKEARPQSERREERRKGGDRRQRDVPVMLDTRGSHERRVSQRDRRGDAPASTEPKGIDVKV